MLPAPRPSAADQCPPSPEFGSLAEPGAVPESARGLQTRSVQGRLQGLESPWVWVLDGRRRSLTRRLGQSPVDLNRASSVCN